MDRDMGVLILFILMLMIVELALVGCVKCRGCLMESIRTRGGFFFDDIEINLQ